MPTKTLSCFSVFERSNFRIDSVFDFLVSPHDVQPFHLIFQEFIT